MGMNWTELRGKSKQSCPRVSETKRNTCVCYFVLLNWYWGINERSRGFFTREPREYVPTIENHRHTTSPWPPLDNLGWSDPRHEGNLWAFLFGSNPATICTFCHHSLCTHTPTGQPANISRFFCIFVQIIHRVAPQILCIHHIVAREINQVFPVW